MAGAGKRSIKKERTHGNASSDDDSSKSSNSKQQSHSSSSGPSASRSASATHPASAPVSSQHVSRSSPPRFDGNRDPEGAVMISNSIKNLDVGMSAWSTIRGVQVNMNVPKRPAKPSSIGKEILMGLNTFNVTALPTREIWQYDVLIGSGTEKRGLIKKLWDSKAVKKNLKQGWLFDGNKLAWSTESIERELRINVDLDEEEGRVVRPGGKENKHRVIIKRTTPVRFNVLNAYLEGSCDFDNKCLEAITFSDHLMRETPSQKFTAIKRNFFAKGQQRFNLSPGVEAFKGCYQSIRIAHQAGGKHCLTVNVDVANGTFWTAGLLSKAVANILNANESQIATAVNTSKGADIVKKLRKLHVVATHNDISYCIDRILNKSSRNHKFMAKDPKTGVEKQLSIYDYFQQRYNQRLAYPDWPLVQMTNKSVLPLELLKLKENQRYVYKLDERQTAQMIKFAVTPPQERWKAVQHGLDMVSWGSDPHLKSYGMTINPNQVVVKGRLLQAPEVQFTGSVAKPGTSGRWDLKSKKFLITDPTPLKTWGVCVVQGRQGAPNKDVISKFISEFVRVYQAHGGKVEAKSPTLHLASGPDAASAVTEIWNKAGSATKTRPQILVFILPDKDASYYGRIKKSCECRYGVVSQCMQYAHVMKCQAQYISNVCMKFNAKLGGVTARAIGPQTKGPTGIFKLPTMCIGADVSHAAPGIQAASTAAITMSTDVLCTRYAALAETNGIRVEMITKQNITKLLKPMINAWKMSVGKGALPGRIYYFRDGVSEGQFAHVLQQEVNDIKEALLELDPKSKVPFVVIVGSKRHHIRFFPRPGDSSTGDRNGNPLPGTLIETGVTHPHENDFYLCAHAAIKGTARPTHYHVLLNEAQVTNEEIQTLIYEHSYQYIRATTPVSIFPAIYYAHIASLRSAHHHPAFGGGSNDQGGKGSGSGSRSGSRDRSGSRGASPSRGSSTDVPDIVDLLPMVNTDNLNMSMWYI